jgi:hypothetical protein
MRGGAFCPKSHAISVYTLGDSDSNLSFGQQASHAKKESYHARPRMTSTSTSCNVRWYSGDDAFLTVVDGHLATGGINLGF